ncbi:MAG: hypothetical protein HRT86_09100 [Ilumatobacteraceae bacterium]|nr:hypothetical protein [Ilumatobacteraceae bacterium]
MLRTRRQITNFATDRSSSAMGNFPAEDRAICERIQRGVSGEYTPGPLVPMEHIVVDFHHALDCAL